MPTNPLSLIPAPARIAAYLVYAVGGVLLTYLESRGVVGAAELTAWAGLGAVLGVTAASNVDVGTPGEYVPEHTEPIPGTVLDESQLP